MYSSIVDYESACRLLLDQTRAESMDSFLGRLQRGQPPVPGQVTSILLALKVVFDTLKGEPVIERSLALSLFLISNQARQLFEAGLKRSLDCPPLLNEDLERIARAVRSIFSGEWQT